MTELQAIEELTDLADRADVEKLLRRFYGRVPIDDLLAEPFAAVHEVNNGLDAHIPVMADFWETILFRVRRFTGRLRHRCA